MSSVTPFPRRSTGERTTPSTSRNHRMLSSEHRSRRAWVPVVGLLTAGALALGPGAAADVTDDADSGSIPAAERQPTAIPAPGTTPSDPVIAEGGLLIVQMSAAPLAEYDGGVAGIPGTRVAAGERLDATSEASVRYQDHLLEDQLEVLSEAGLGVDDVVDQYTVAFNGVAVEADGAQARELLATGRVSGVWENEVLTAQTISTPDDLGLSGADGVWAQRFGGPEGAGAGMIIGVIDSGIVPENPSFADLEGVSVPERWNGRCDAGEDETFTCNTKVIGARYYGAKYGNPLPSDEILSPRDVNGHGSHTAGTAAGNAGIPMAVNGEPVGTGAGIAPGAQIAVYKGLWGAGGGGSMAGLVAAIDDAVADGVDVINFSVGGGMRDTISPYGLAMKGAAEAGVFVSAAAGNSGLDGAGTVENAYPWVTTVGATTSARRGAKTVSYGDARVISGKGYTDGVTAPAVLSSDVVTEATVEADQCPAGLMDADLVRGRIVLCEAANYIGSSADLKELGAAGVVFYYSRLLDIPADAFGYPGLPSIGLASADNGPLVSYITQNPGAEITISGVLDEDPQWPELAWFSSTGPSVLNRGDLIKADIVAPGVDIVAPWAPGAEDYMGVSGTSMATPHVAGLAALLMTEYPDWDVSAVKSALMTTANPIDSAGEPIQLHDEDTDLTQIGSGFVEPPSSFEPGLVYVTDPQEWTEYVCAMSPGPGLDCPQLPQTVSDMNYPSIAVGEDGVSRTVTRTVTDVTGEGGTWTAEIESGDESQITVSPSELTIEPGGSATFEVTVDYAADDYFGDRTLGSLTWVNGDLRVRSPITAEPSPVAGAPAFFGEGTAGQGGLPIQAGASGSYTLYGSELVTMEPKVAQGNLVEYAWQWEDTPSYLRVETRAEDFPPGVEVDLMLVRTSGLLGFTPVAYSANPGADEEIVISDTRSENLILVFASPDPNVSDDWPYHEAVVTVGDMFEPEPDPDPDAPRISLTPETFTADAGQTVDVTASWEGLEPDQQYFGVVRQEADFIATSSITSVQIDTTQEWEPAAERWAGEDRYETAALVAEQFAGPVDTVYVASGEAYADALAGGPAGARGLIPDVRRDGNAAPVLLVKPDRIPQPTAAALESLAPRRVVVLGGETVVGSDVADDLAEVVGGADRVHRVQGEDRYATAADLAEQYETEQDTVYIARGDDGGLADALTAGALAGAESAPVLLVKEGSVPGATRAALDHLDPDEIVVLGGEEAIDSVVTDSLKSWGRVSRLYGEDRYGTSAAISSAFEARPERAYVARGDEFADALAIASLAGSRREPIVLVQPDHLPAVIPPAIAALGPQMLTVVGGETAITPRVLDLLGDPGTYLPE